MAKCKRCGATVEWKETEGRNLPTEEDVRHCCTFYAWITSYQSESRRDKKTIICPPEHALQRFAMFLMPDEEVEFDEIMQTLGGLPWSSWNNKHGEMQGQGRFDIFTRYTNDTPTNQQLLKLKERGASDERITILPRI